MQLRRTVLVAICVLAPALPSLVSAQTRTAFCEYYNASGNKSVNGPCLVTQTSAPGDATYAIKVTIPSIEVDVRYLKHQGEFHRWTMNGASAAAYEIHRDHICGFTDDLNVTLCIRDGEAAKNATVQSTPPGGPPPAASEKPFYVGRWYVDDPRVCRGRSGETEGLMTYTDRQAIGYENRCDILSATPAANRVELQLKCTGEGMTSRSREVVQLLRNGQLSRIDFDGPKPSKFEYKRCP